MAANILKIGGADLKDFTLSKSSSQRKRKSEIKKAEKIIKNRFKASLPQNLIIHWDSKKIKYRKRMNSDERLAVVASTTCTDQTNQFLAAPCIPDGTGVSQCDAITKIVIVIL